MQKNVYNAYIQKLAAIKAILVSQTLTWPITTDLNVYIKIHNILNFLQLFTKRFSYLLCLGLKATPNKRPH